MYLVQLIEEVIQLELEDEQWYLNGLIESGGELRRTSMPNTLAHSIRSTQQISMVANETIKSKVRPNDLVKLSSLGFLDDYI